MLHARTWAEIDLDALAHNFDVIRREAGGGAGVMVVLKADAYGHGAVPVAWQLTRKHEVVYLGVGDSTEALELRGAGVTSPLLVLGAVVAGELEDVVRGRIALTVHASDRVRQLRRLVRSNGVDRVRLHLKVDTGMGRLGCRPERALGIAREIRRSRGLELEGVATHLAATGPDCADSAERQIRRFRRTLKSLEADGFDPTWRHAYASGGVLSDLPVSPFNLVRPGLALYGVAPHPAAPPDLRPVLAWKTQIVFLKDHRKGSPIGYGGTWKTPSKRRIATLPVGYNDGYRFAFSNRAHVLVRGRRCPVVGRVSMDYVCADVSDVPGTEVGDTVTLLGPDGDGCVPVEELADLAQTIPYEILCGIGRRVKRVYLGGNGHAPFEGA